MPTATETIDRDTGVEVKKTVTANTIEVLKLRLHRQAGQLLLQLRSNAGFETLRDPGGRGFTVAGVSCYSIPQIQPVDLSQFGFSATWNKAGNGLFYSGLDYLNISVLFAKEMREGVTFTLNDPPMSSERLRTACKALRHAALTVYKNHLMPLDFRAELIMREIV